MHHNCVSMKEYLFYSSSDSSFRKSKFATFYNRLYKFRAMFSYNFDRWTQPCKTGP